MSEELVENSRVLIVEDERITSLDLERILKDKGYTVIGRVDTGEEAVSRAVEETPDLILMDIMLAGPMDGISAAASISDQVKIPIIFLTAHNDQATLNRAQFTEPYGYILKPYRDAEVHAVIQMTLYRNRLERKRLSSNSN